MEQIIKKTLLMLCVISIIAAGMPAALATNNETNVTATPTANVTVTPAVTTPVVTTPTVAATPGAFRQAPKVTLRPVNDEVNKSADILLELYMWNPSLNDVTLNVDASVSVPSGLHVYGEGFGAAGAAGTVSGIFSVPPGKGRTIYLNVKSEKVGTFTAQSSLTYWPGDDKDSYNQFTFTHPIRVSEASSNPSDPKPSNPIAAGGEIPLTWIILAAVILGGIAVIFGLGRRPPKTEVNLQQ